MAGLFTMAKKEFLDIIGEKKFLLIFATLLIVILVSTFEGGLSYSSSQSSTISVLSGNSTRPGGAETRRISRPSARLRVYPGPLAA